MITAIPDWLVLICAVVGAWFLISVAVITPFIILNAVTRRHDRQRDAETVRRAGAALVAEAERVTREEAS
jgi:uncharacterized membrane protein